MWQVVLSRCRYWPILIPTGNNLEVCHFPPEDRTINPPTDSRVAPDRKSLVEFDFTEEQSSLNAWSLLNRLKRGDGSWRRFIPDVDDRRSIRVCWRSTVMASQVQAHHLA
jgi:hypothetical protein